MAVKAQSAIRYRRTTDTATARSCVVTMSAISAIDPFSTIVGLRVGDWNFGLIAICAAFVVFVASYDRNYVCPGGWLRRSLIWVGGRSYAIYLVAHGLRLPQMAASHAAAGPCSEQHFRSVMAASLRLAGDERPVHVSFQSRGEEVELPADLVQQYPDEITIILQYEFDNLIP